MINSWLPFTMYTIHVYYIITTSCEPVGYQSPTNIINLASQKDCFVSRIIETTATLVKLHIAIRRQITQNINRQYPHWLNDNVLSSVLINQNEL